jgi:hypothetical protein
MDFSGILLNESKDRVFRLVAANREKKETSINYKYMTPHGVFITPFL